MQDLISLNSAFGSFFVIICSFIWVNRSGRLLSYGLLVATPTIKASVRDLLPKIFQLDSERERNTRIQGYATYPKDSHWRYRDQLQSFQDPRFSRHLANNSLKLKVTEHIRISSIRLQLLATEASAGSLSEYKSHLSLSYYLF